VPPFTVLHVCMGNICRSPMAERLLTVAVAQAAGVERKVAEELVHSHSAGTGGWHAGEEMHPSAARQVQARGGDPSGFTARRLRSDHLDAADLVLVATADQQLYVTALRPDAAPRTFVLGELGRLLRLIDPAALPSAPKPAASPAATSLAALDRSDPASSAASLASLDRSDAASSAASLASLDRSDAASSAASLASLDRSDATPMVQAVYDRGLALVAALDAARAGAAPLPGDDLDDPWGRGEKTFARVAEEIDDLLRPLAAALFPWQERRD
jgi:protein-tyrosine phosphatase